MGLFDIGKTLSRKRELRESKDEIFLGELINYIYKNGGVLVDIKTDGESNHTLTFRYVNHPIIHFLKVGVSRKVDGLMSNIVGSQSVLSFEVIIRNEIVEPEDIIRMYHTDLQNMFKIPAFGNVKIDHDLNYIIAKTNYIIDLNKFVDSNGVNREELISKLDEIINLLIDHLKPLKKVFDDEGSEKNIE